MNVFRCTPDRSLDRYYLRTCAIYRLLKHGHVDKADRLDGTIEIWLAGPLKARA
jgi:hypothetical protein